MLTFITAVRHPQNSVSYERVGRLLDATLHSVCRQTDPDFRAIVVCNEMPDVDISDSRIEFIEVKFPPPSLEKGAKVDFNAGVLDKGAKLSIGVLAARKHAPTHVMFLDCDDLIHHGLAEFVNQHPTKAGWYSESGYLHTVGTGFVQFVTPNFHLKCGSSDVIRTDLIPVPPDLPLDSAPGDLIEAVGQETLYRVLATSGNWGKHLEPFGISVEPLPFPAAIWMIGNGENASGNLISSRSRTRIGPDITEAYDLTPPSRLSSGKRELEIAVERLSRRVRRR